MYQELTYSYRGFTRGVDYTDARGFSKGGGYSCLLEEVDGR